MTSDTNALYAIVEKKDRDAVEWAIWRAYQEEGRDALPAAERYAALLAQIEEQQKRIEELEKENARLRDGEEGDGWKLLGTYWRPFREGDDLPPT